MQYQLIKTKRTSISLQVIAGKVVVRAPLSINKSYIETFLSNKSSWIQARLSQQQLDKASQNQLSVGGQIWFAGKLYPLVVTRGEVNQTCFDGKSITLTVKVTKALNTQPSLIPEIPDHLIKKRLESWFKQQAQDYIIPRTNCYSQTMALIPKLITIRQYKARWGSCNSLGNIQFNYLLMMAPTWVVDYVIVHELSHLKYLNHSHQFWQVVEQYYPDFRLAKKWLKDHQRQLQWTP
ncbi:M48 family metallopeptidase [Thalassotalea piscium]